MYIGKEKLNTCDTKLIFLIEELAKIMDIYVLIGHRGEKEQQLAFKNKKSKLQYPKSKHNKIPSLAVDIAPYPIDWNNIDRFKEMITKIKEIANNNKIKIRCGADFKTLVDYPHIELKV